MADNYPEIQIEIQPQNPVIQMTVERGARLADAVKVISRTRSVYVPSDNKQVIARYSSKQSDFSSYVPEGYTCIGYNDAKLENISGSYTIDIGDSSTVTFRAGSSAVTATGEQTTQSGKRYYYTEKATLICVKDGVLDT